MLSMIFDKGLHECIEDQVFIFKAESSKTFIHVIPCNFFCSYILVYYVTAKKFAFSKFFDFLDELK